jgi:NadR type nicotinamide-nucleotide adenylyltransferase
MKRIVITGAESTGKSTLIKKLAAHYGEPWSDEYVRKYVDAIHHELSVDDLEPIACGQLVEEDSKLTEAKQFVLHDTNILSSIIYASYYFDTEIEWVNDAFLERDYTLYLLCMPDIPWVADAGQRESPEAREILHELFKDSLDILQIPYIEIYGTREARLTQAVQAINAVL